MAVRRLIWRRAQVTDLLSRMTPAAARLDLQSSAFQELLAQQELSRKQPGTVCGTEPWRAAASHTRLLSAACLPECPSSDCHSCTTTSGQEGCLGALRGACATEFCGHARDVLCRSTLHVEQENPGNPKTLGAALQV